MGLNKVIEMDVCDDVAGSHRSELETKDCLFLVYRIL